MSEKYNFKMFTKEKKTNKIINKKKIKRDGGVTSLDILMH